MKKNQFDKGGVGSTVLIIILALVVIGGMVWFTKPWERWWTWQDEKKIEKANWLGKQLSGYYDSHKSWPWNHIVKGYIPSEYQRRAESPFIYSPYQNENKDWLSAFFEVENSEPKLVDYFNKNDIYTIAKQISAGRRVGICFKPSSEKYQEQVVADCFTNDFGQRNTLGIIDGYDICEDNLYCVVQE